MTDNLIPEAALDKHVALLGMTGAGKSSVIRAAIVEPDLEEGKRVCIVTPKDDWWGLRLSKSGKSKGFDIPIFGGRHADYPLNVKDAALLAEAYGTMKGSAIFCTSRLSVQDRARWFAAFAESLLMKNKGWLRLVIDEAHVFMPKQGGKGGGAIPASLHAGNELVSQGRSLGLRIVLASQRSAKLHNDALTQCSCLIAMLLMAPHDREAVKDWIEDQADPVKGREIIASLANLSEGQAWVWAPRAKMLKKIQFPMPRTFDSSAAPDEGTGEGPSLAPINLDALKGKLAAVEAEQKANDPKELRNEVTRLKKANADLIAQIGAGIAADPEEISNAEKKGFERAKKESIAAAKTLLADAVADIEKDVGHFDQLVKDAIHSMRNVVADRLRALVRERQAIAPVYAPEIMSVPAKKSTTTIPTAALPNSNHVVSPINDVFLEYIQQVDPAYAYGAGRSLERPLQKIVDSIRWWNVMGIAQPSQAQVAFVAGYSHKSGTWATYLSKLRKAELIDGSGTLRLTGEGGRLANEPTSPPTGEALRRAVLDKLDNPLVRILTPILNAHPDAMSQSDAGDAAGYSSSSGTWATYLSRLRSMDLIEGSRELKAQNWLFP